MYKDYSNYNFIHEAILYETVDKYETPKKHPFYIKALVPKVFSCSSITLHYVMRKCPGHHVFKDEVKVSFFRH